MVRQSKEDATIFAVASQLYVHLRRATGRVIDVIYLEKDWRYANEVIHFANQSSDEKVQQFAKILQKQILESQSYLKFESTAQVVPEPAAVMKDEKFQAEIAHHYIGALR